MDISVIIPNYNGGELLKKNLQKVFDVIAASKKDYEIIITDDASSDDSISFLKRFKKNTSFPLVILESPFSKNSGFSANVNRGVRSAKGEIVILLNTDVIPHYGFLDHLLPRFLDEKVFAVGCKDESVEDEKIVLRGRGIGFWKKGFLLHAAGEVNRQNTLWVSGGSGAFRKSIWDKIGGLNEIYDPFYWEDIDLSYRAQKMGYMVIFEPKSIVTHEHSKGAIKKNFKADVVKRIAYRNQFFFVWLNISDIKLLMSHIFWLPYHLLAATYGRNKIFLFGFLSAIEKLPEVLFQREKIQKKFILSDKEILKMYL